MSTPAAAGPRPAPRPDQGRRRLPSPRRPRTRARPAWSMPHRLARLVVGQLLFGVALAMLLRADLGPAPWDVLHSGLVLRTGWAFGLVLVLSSLVVLLLWIPLRVRPGVGTVGNVVLVAVGIELGLAVLPAAGSLPVAVGVLVGGILLNGFATALYVGVQLGPGPRDGLMTGLVARTGRPVHLVRGSLEVGVVALGWLLGGTVGVGTLAFALGIGPVVGLLLPRLTMPAAGGGGGTDAVVAPTAATTRLLAPPRHGRFDGRADEVASPG